MKQILLILLIMLSSVNLRAEDKIAPDFRLKDLNGKTVKLYDALKKGPVLLDFWATWCKGCKEEMPMLDELGKKYRDKGLQTFLVSIDKGSGVSKAKTYVKAEDFSFNVLFDKSNRVFRKYSQGNKSVPLTLIIDQEKKITFTLRGKGTEEMFEDEILKVLD